MDHISVTYLLPSPTVYGANFTFYCLLNNGQYAGEGWTSVDTQNFTHLPHGSPIYSKMQT